jgi:predicted transcriptional regulator
MEKTTLYLPSELQRTLRDLSQRTGRAQASIIREALAEWVSRQDQPWPRSIGSAADGSVSGRDSENWLADEWARADARPLRRTPRG